MRAVTAQAALLRRLPAAAATPVTFASRAASTAPGSPRAPAQQRQRSREAGARPQQSQQQRPQQQQQRQRPDAARRRSPGGPGQGRPPPTALSRVRTVSQFAALRDSMRQRLLQDDVAEPLAVLLGLLERERTPPAQIRSHPVMVALLGDIRAALNPGTCTIRSWATAARQHAQAQQPQAAATVEGAAAAVAAPAPAAVDGDSSSSSSSSSNSNSNSAAAAPPPPRSIFRAHELSRLASTLVANGLHAEGGGDLMGALVRELTDQVAHMGALDTRRTLWAVDSGRVHAPALVAALARHAGSQLAYLDAYSLCEIAHILAVSRPGGCPPPEPGLFQALATRLGGLLAGAPKGAAGGAPGAPAGGGAAALSGPLHPHKFAQGLMALTAAGLRSGALIAATGRGFSLGGGDVEARYVRYVIKQLPGMEARDLVSVARCVGLMGLTARDLPGGGRKAAASAKGAADGPSTTGTGMAATTAVDGAAPDRLWGAIEARAARLMPSLGPQDLSFLATALAHASKSLGAEAAAAAARRSAAKQQLDGLLLREQGEGAPLPALAALDAAAAGGDGAPADGGADAAATLGVDGTSYRVGSDGLWAGLRTAIVARLPESSAETVTYSLWALSSVGLADGPLLADAARRMAELAASVRLSTVPAPAPAEEQQPSEAAANAAEPTQHSEGEAAPAAPAAADGADVADGAVAAGAWSGDSWASLGAAFGSGLLRCASSFARIASTVPPAVVVLGPAIDGSGGAADGAATTATPEQLWRLHSVLGGLTALTATTARATFEAAVAPQADGATAAAAAAPTSARRRPASSPSPSSPPAALMPINLYDASSLLDAAVAYGLGVERSIQAGLLPGDDEGTARGLEELRLAVKQLAAASAVRINGASDAELMRGAGSTSVGIASYRRTSRALREALAWSANVGSDGSSVSGSAAAAAAAAAAPEVAALIDEAALRLTGVKDALLARSPRTPHNAARQARTGAGSSQ
jgi:hypothetical protein